MNKTFKFRKIFRAFLSIVLILVITLSFSGCGERETTGTDENKISATDKKEESLTGTEYTLINAFSAPAFHNNYEQVLPMRKGKIETGGRLQRVLRDYGNQDVMIDYVVAFGYGNHLGDVEEFAKRIGALKVYDSEECGLEDGAYRIIGGPQVAENIEKAGYAGYYIDVLHCENVSRPDGYSSIITDSLAALLDNMKSDETIEVVVSTKADRTNIYVRLCGHYIEMVYNRELYVPINSGLKDFLPYDEYRRLSEERVNNILLRNNITDDKIIPTDVLLGISESEEMYDKYVKPGIPDPSEINITSGFAAKLTKAEILALAEDEDVKVIHNDTVISTYTVYEE